MAKVGAQRAAELTGRSKSTIQRAMKSGKISYEMDANDRRVIDVAELERAFGLVPQQGEAQSQSAMHSEIEKATQLLEIERLKMRIKFLEEHNDALQSQIEDLKSQRDQWQKQAQQVLLTSQYSQKQAEELSEKLKERERIARERKQQEMARRASTSSTQPVKKTMAPANKNTGKTRPLTQKNSGGIQGFISKIVGSEGKKAAGSQS